MPLKRDYLVDIAEAFLDIAVEALAVTSRGVPSQRVISHGTPPVDDCCDYVNVVYGGFRPTLPGSLGPAVAAGNPAEVCAETAWAAEFNLTVARSYAPTVRPSRRQPIPSQADNQQNAESLLEDAVVLLHQVLPVLGGIGPPWPWIGRMIYQAGRVTPFDQGGCAGWSAAAAFTLPLNPPQV